MPRRVFFPLLGFVLLGGIASACPTAFVDDKTKEEKIKVTLVVILASEEGTEIDPRLKQIAEEVQKRDPQLKSFKVQTQTVRKLAENEKSVFNLVEQKSADVIVKHGADGGNKVAIAVTAPDQGEIVYRTACGKYFPIVTRHQTKNRERLILALRVDPCQAN
jgi:hypothetical protein